MVNKHDLNHMQFLIDNIKKYCADDENGLTSVQTDERLSDGGGNLGHFTNVQFGEMGLLLDFTINWTGGTVYIEEYSEDPDLDGSTMTMPEFCQWQNGFIQYGLTEVEKK